MAITMRTITLLFGVWLVALSAFGANPDYRSFRGTGGIAITTNPPTGLIIIDGSGIFTSSGTNATISVSTNGVLVAVASTNINFTPGNNVVLKATNMTSRSHIDYGIKSNLSFFATGGEFVLGSWGGVVGISNVNNGRMSLFLTDVSGDTWNVTGELTANNATFDDMGGEGDFVAIAPDGTLQRTNFGTALNVYLLTYILPVLVVDIATITNLGAFPPISSVQYNSNGVVRGAVRFVFTNDTVRPQVGIGTGIPAAGSTLDITGRLHAADAQITNIVVAGQGVEVTTGSLVLNGGTTALAAWNGLGRIRWDADGVMRLENDASLGFNRINLGPNGAGSPALGATNGDAIILGADGAFGAVATNRLHVPGGIVLTNANVAAGRVWTAVGGLGGGTWSNAPTVSASAETNVVLTNLIGTVARNVTNVVSLSTTNATSKPLTNSYANGVLTLFGLEPGANVTITPNGSNLVIAATSGSATAETNAVLTNLIGTVARNITNFVSLSTSNATSKPLSNSYAAGVLTVFGLEAGANVTLSQNASNIVITGASSSFAAGNSNQIPFINGPKTGYTYAGYLSSTNPGFGFSPSGPEGHGYGGLMVFADSPLGLVTIGHPNAGSDFSTLATALVVSNRYNGLGNFKNDMIKIDAVLVNASTLQSDSTMTRWRVWQAPSGGGASTSSNDVAELTIDGRLKLYGGTLYRSNTVALPTAAELGAGGYWVGVSNNANANTLVSIYSVDGSSTVMKHLVP